VGKIKLFRQLAAEEISLQHNPFPSELVLEAFLVENPSVLAVDETMQPSVLNTQLHLFGGRPDKGTDGRIDMLCELTDNSVAVIENKIGCLEDQHLEQLQTYLDTTEKNQRNELEAYIDDKQLVGMIVGTDISDELRKKITDGSASPSHQIYAVILERFTNDKRTENYFLIEHISARRGINRHRFKSYSEFRSHQKEKGMPDQIFEMSDALYEYMIQEFNEDIECIQFARDVFTFSVPKRKRSRVFFYALLQKSGIKIYLHSKEPLSQRAERHPQIDRYPDQIFIRLRSKAEIDDQVKVAIKHSYQVQMADSSHEDLI